MSNVRRFCLISSFIAVAAIAPIVELATLNVAPASAQFWLSLGRRRPTVPLGTRGELCPMTPGLLDKDFTVISDRPLFTWKGKAVKLNVRDLKTKQIVWSADLAPNTQQIVYGGEMPLQPNRVYQWQILGENPKKLDQDRWDAVAVMSETERNQHNAQLQALEQKAKSQNQSEAAIADIKVDYLLDPSRELWSEAVQVLYEVKNPSPEFVQSRKKFMENLCTEHKTASARSQ